ncbi:hypothetical protein C8R43DRAFT_940896 [Mycena crocata]|nr:hypothetical protein C8R43DRAFT_940896 [Mycena crocata]
MVPPLEFATRGGFDLTFGTNVVDHFYLTKLLLPALVAAVAGNPSTGRVINLTSVTWRFLIIGLSEMGSFVVERSHLICTPRVNGRMRCFLRSSTTVWGIDTSTPAATEKSLM